VYELVLTPKDTATLVGSVRIAIDSQEHVPVRVQVYSTKLGNPAFEVGFTAVDFSRPDARQFAFTPPPGTTVTQSDALSASKGSAGTNRAPTSPTTPAGRATKPSTGTTTDEKAPTTIGSGWSTVVVAPFTLPTSQTGGARSTGEGAAQLTSILRALPTTTGTWGTGHVLEGTLFSLVLTTDGRLAVGAVRPARLYSALAAR
jgi:hypothetical protein